MNTIRGSAAALIAAAGITLAACGGTPALSSACRAAQAREFAVARETRWAAARSAQAPYSQMYLTDQGRERQALKAMKAAGCPGDTKVAGPY